MPDTWNTKTTHFSDDDGNEIELPGPARRFSEFLRAIMLALAEAVPGEGVDTRVPCRRRPGRHPCVGRIQGTLTSELDIEWECPSCGDHGLITCGLREPWESSPQGHLVETAPQIRAREPVILASNVALLAAWYQVVLGFTVVQRFEDEYDYCNLETPTGFRIGIGDAAQMGIAPTDRSQNTVVLQLEVDDLRAFFGHLKAIGVDATIGPSLDKKGGFWYGGFSDLDGNPWWVVDKNCP